jgi:hypothetical protein
MLCRLVTKVSKKLHVCRAIILNACRSPAVNGSRCAAGSGLLTRRAMAGAQAHAARKGAAIQANPWGETLKSTAMVTHRRTPPLIRRYVPYQLDDAPVLDCAVAVHSSRCRCETVIRYNARQMPSLVTHAASAQNTRRSASSDSDALRSFRAAPR